MGDRGFAASWGGRSAIDRLASYKMEDCVPEELREEALELYHAEGFFAGLPSDKTLVRGDLLIDDKPRVGGQERLPSWEHVVFDAPYNRDTAHKLRLGDWAGWRGVMPWELAQGAGRAD